MENENISDASVMHVASGKNSIHFKNMHYKWIITIVICNVIKGNYKCH